MGLEREMPAVSVGISKSGMIRVEQIHQFDEPTVLLIHPGQVDTVCEWLRETRDEVLKLVSEGELPEVDEDAGDDDDEEEGAR